MNKRAEILQGVLTIGGIFVSLAVATTFAITLLYAGTIVKPNTFTAGTVIRAAQINDNFDTIYNEFNGEIENANIKDSTITETKLNLSDNSISGAKITDSTITETKLNLSDGSIPETSLGSIDGSKLRDGTVTAAKLADGTSQDTDLLMIVVDQKNAGTDGGTFTAGAWRTRALNTTRHNGISGASLASNQITLPAGTYYFDILAPAFKVDQHKAILYDTTASDTLIVGATTYNDDGGNYANTISFIRGVATLAAASVLEVRHICATTNADDGFGWANTNFSVVEIYSQVYIKKIN